MSVHAALTLSSSLTMCVCFFADTNHDFEGKSGCLLNKRAPDSGMQRYRHAVVMTYAMFSCTYHALKCVILLSRSLQKFAHMLSDLSPSEPRCSFFDVHVADCWNYPSSRSHASFWMTCTTQVIVFIAFRWCVVYWLPVSNIYFSSTSAWLFAWICTIKRSRLCDMRRTPRQSGRAQKR